MSKICDLELNAKELVELSSVLDVELQQHEMDNNPSKKESARYEVLLRIYQKLLKPTMLAYISNE
jgi:hypothetical protein